MGHEAAEHPALASVPEVPARFILTACALARNDKDVAMAFGLTADKEPAERHVGVLLAQPMKVEPCVDLAVATGEPAAYLRIEGCGRRR